MTNSPETESSVIAALTKAETFIAAISGFYGQGLQILGWHGDDEMEPLDTLISDSSDGTELEAVREALAKVRGDVG
jgi:hypothetical protein